VERVLLHTLKEGQTAEFFAVLAGRDRKTASNGKPYFDVELRDRKKTFRAKVWGDSVCYEACDRVWDVGQHFLVHARHDPKWNQLVILEARPVNDDDRRDGYDPAMFERTTRFDVEELFTEILAYAKKIEDEPLRKLVLGLLWKNEAAIKRHPAAARNHHAYRGGYLEHTVSVVRTGWHLAEKYYEYYPDFSPPLNKDLILAGCILHDIGKLDELEFLADGIGYTVRGHLVGHILVGRDMVREAAKEAPDLSPELLLLLEHVILSHQGAREWDSPREPMLPEALLVHFADDIDAKLNMFASILERSENDGPFTEANNIFRRRLLKQRTV
jgi:3'-5' exoribonuclease